MLISKKSLMKPLLAFLLNLHSNLTPQNPDQLKAYLIIQPKGLSNILDN